VSRAVSADRGSIDAPAGPGWPVRAVRWVHTKLTRPPEVRPYLVGELVVVLCLLKLYDLVREHADVRRADALNNGTQLLHLERWLHIDIERSVNRWSVAHHPISLVASYWYQFGHITVTMLVLLWCWRQRPSAYRRFRNALVLINLAGLAVFLALPMAPPRLLPGAGFIDADKIAGFYSNNVGPVTADAYGAFPSLHIAWAVWTAAVCFELVRHRRLARLWLGYPLITFMAIVATGNHFVLDAVAGLLIAIVALKVVDRRVTDRRGPGRRGGQQHASSEASSA
jgi:hypothetical protein